MCLVQDNRIKKSDTSELWSSKFWLWYCPFQKQFQLAFSIELFCTRFCRYLTHRVWITYYEGISKWLKLTRLSKPATFNSYVKPVPLPSSFAPDGEDCLITGWGKMSSYSSSYPDRLRAADSDNQALLSELFHWSFRQKVTTVYVLNENECENAYPTLITSRMMCIGLLYGGKDSCKGDGGGPAVCDGRVQGIVSWGYECGYGTGVYTNVFEFNDWIRGVMSFN